MSITIQFDQNFVSATGFNSLKSYFDYYQSSFVSPDHAATLGFHNSPGNLTLGTATGTQTTYTDVYPGIGLQIIGEYLSNTAVTVPPATSPAANVDFLIRAGEVTLENSVNGNYDVSAMLYTGPTNPGAHRLAGDIQELTFGSGGYSSGSLASELFTITGLTQHIGNGFLDTNSNGYYDAINSNTSTNLVHQLIYNLMGGMGGSGGTSVLEDYLNTYGTTQIGALDGATVLGERFDPFDAQDTFVLNGGLWDYINEGFQTGSGGDVIDLTGYNTFTSATDAANAVFYSALFGDAFLSYVDSSSNVHAVRIVGVTGGLTEENFIV